MKPQLVVIHGGMVYPTHEAYIHALKTDPVDLGYFQRHKKWKDTLEEELKDVYEILRPEMPSPRNAQYSEWVIWFERMIPFLRDGVILVGHSLGGVFLARYLNEHDMPAQIKATLLLAAPYDDESVEPLGEFCIRTPLEKLSLQGGEIHVWNSSDDPVVVIGEQEKYAKALPSAHIRTFTDRGHFSLETFPEMVEFLKNI